MIQNLAYVAFRSAASEDWRGFGADVVGAALAPDGEDGSVRVRFDARPWRIAVAPGERDELDCIGWDVRAEDFDSTIETIEAFGCAVERSAERAEARRASQCASFVDPFGLRHELVVGVEEVDDFEPASTMHGDFVTAEQGMGHIVLMVPNLADGVRFVTEALGLVLSDTIEDGQTIQFFHCAGTAARHHSLAITEVPGRCGLHHVMVEVSDVDDVGRALDRVRDAGLALSMDYGRHPNDLVTSFYVRTPSGFDLEVGAGGVIIDDTEWQTATYDATSLWGHHPPADGPLRPGILRRLEPSTTEASQPESSTTEPGTTEPGTTERQEPDMVATIDTTDIAVGDVTFHVSQTGQGVGPCLVFLHGSGPGADALSNWEAVIGELGSEFHCVAPDIVGFGHSTHPDPAPDGLKPFTDVRVATLIDLFDQMALEQITLVGNSMGGLISMLIAKERPELVERMVLMGSAGGKAPMLDGLKRLIGFYNDPTTDAMEGLLKGFLHDPSIFGDDLRSIAESRLPNATRAEVKRSHLATFSGAGGRAGLSMDDYPTLTLPVLLLHGDDDQVVSIESSRWLAEQFPNSKLDVFADTGHWLQIEKGPEFNRAVREFVIEGL